MATTSLSRLNLSRYICGALFAAIGILHFVYPATFCKIMPAGMPFPLELVYLSGFFEIAGGLGLFFARVRRASVFGLLLLLIAVFPANINMAVHPELFADIPIWLLYSRLPLQAVIMLWVWSCRL